MINDTYVYQDDSDVVLLKLSILYGIDFYGILNSFDMAIERRTMLYLDNLGLPSSMAMEYMKKSDSVYGMALIEGIQGILDKQP